MLAPTREQLITSLGTIKKVESILSALTLHIGKVAPVSQSQALLDHAVTSVTASEGLIPAQSASLRALLKLEAPAQAKDVTEVNFKEGISPAENRTLQLILKDQTGIRQESAGNRRERITGIVYRAMDVQNFKASWKETQDVVVRNVRLFQVKDPSAYIVLALSDVGKQVNDEVDKFAAEGTAIIRDILARREPIPLLSSLLEKFNPQCVERKSTIADAGLTPQVDTKSHILKQAVSMTFDIVKDPSDNNVLGVPRIYFADRNIGEAYPSAAHELIELGVMQHVLNICKDKEIPSAFVVQYLAETLTSDILVWTTQFKTMEKTLLPQEKNVLMDSTFTILLNLPSKADAIARIIGNDHPLTKELKLYASTAFEVLKGYDPQVFTHAAQEPHSRTAMGQLQYDGFLNSFFKEFLSTVETKGAGKNYILVNPDVLLAEPK